MFPSSKDSGFPIKYYYPENYDQIFYLNSIKNYFKNVWPVPLVVSYSFSDITIKIPIMFPCYSITLRNTYYLIKNIFEVKNTLHEWLEELVKNSQIG